MLLTDFKQSANTDRIQWVLLEWLHQSFMYSLQCENNCIFISFVISSSTRLQQLPDPLHHHHLDVARENSNNFI